jgi:WD repeat and SOF domain-containing protein 1
LWKVDASDFLAADKPVTSMATFLGEHAFSGISHHRKESQFATSGVRVDIWDSTRSQPLHSFAWGADSIYTVKYSPVEVDLLASSSSDCNIVLYDVRNRSPLKKIVLNMTTNAICWNPMEAFNFTIANEDHNCYTFDKRKLDHILNVHEDHVAAVMTLDYSPTGREFCTGSYDRSIRIFDANEGHSREIYHSKRMQRIFSVSCSADNKYLLSGSDDTNIRIWKLQASERLSTLLPRQRNTANYRKKLKEKYQHAPEIRKIANHRLTPKAITSQRKLKDTMKKAKGEKTRRKRVHAKPGAEPFESVKTKKIRRVEV